MNLQLEELQTECIRDGTYTDNEENIHCVLCGKVFSRGEVFPIGGRFYTATKAAEIHRELEHPDYFETVLSRDTKYLPFTANQKSLLRLMRDGYTDKEIAEKMGVASSTVRHQKFMLREKAKRARMFLAVYAMAADTPKMREGKRLNSAVSELERNYGVTALERDRVTETFFASLQPLVLRELPTKERKKIVVLNRIAGQFAKGEKFTERRVNEILKEIYSDYVAIRRYMVEYGLLDRTADGKEYWRR